MNEMLQKAQVDSDPFGLRDIDFSMRIPEKSEMFEPSEAKAYIEGCDYPESVDELLLASEIVRLFSPRHFREMKIMDVMCGPGRLGRELLALGAQHVIFHDGDGIMVDHAKKEASQILLPRQNMGVVRSPVDRIPLPDNELDLTLSHNSIHQLSDLDKLKTVIT